MIDRLRLITLRSQWLKPIAVMSVFGSLGLFAYVVLGSTGIAENDYYLIPSVITLLWAITVCIFLYGFPNVPEKPNKDQGFFRRIVIRIQRTFYSLLAIVCLGLTAVVVFYSYKIFTIWLQNYG